MIVIFLGPPGSGKGTQSFFVSQMFSIPHLSTGEMLRHEIQSNTVLGKKIKLEVSKGALVSEDLINDMVAAKLRESGANGAVLDGYPRTISQAKFLKTIVKDEIIVLYFDVTDEIVIERIIGRYSCKDCGAIYHNKFNAPTELGVCDKCKSENFMQRPDDILSSVANRLLTYHQETKLLLDFFEADNNLYRLDASESVSKVRNDIMEALKKC